MDIPNLSPEPVTEPVTPIKPAKNFPVLTLIIILLALAAGFTLSRFYPLSSEGTASPLIGNSETKVVSADSITDSQDLKVGVVYGNQQAEFKDIAVGVVEKGNINGEGTHILNREGGASQRASLISSAVDLDLFVGKKVEVKGQTNASTKTSWLLDVGNIKILE